MAPTIEDFPLTCGQRSLVYRFERTPESARPLQRIYRLRKDFNYCTFAEALRRTIAVHPSLRLKLKKKEGCWMQYFPDQSGNISIEKVRGISSSYRSIYAGLLISEERKHTLDLSKEPPVNAKVIRVNGEFVLSLCVDHIAADGLSFNLLEKELLRYYEQIDAGLSTPRALSAAFLAYLSKEQALQYREHGNLLFWQRQLMDAPSIRGPISDLKSVPAEIFTYHLTGLGFRFFLNFCRCHNCTPLTVVVAANLLLLSEIGNLSDIVLSLPFSNRVDAEEQAIIGNLMVPLHIRFSIIANEPMRDFLIRIKKQVLNAMLHRQCDLPALYHLLKSEAKPRNSQIFLTNACDLMVDNNSLNYPNKLFSERLDNKMVSSSNVYRRDFGFIGILSTSSINFTLNWDGSYWPIAASEMESKFLATLNKICE
jgi:hypothetical protein